MLDGKSTRVDDFCVLFRRVGKSAAILTANLPTGPAGRTITSFCSVSRTPPVILVCLHRLGPFCDDLISGGEFALNLPAEEDIPLLLRFAEASKSKPDDLFATERWEWSGTPPVLLDGLGWITCKVTQVYPAETHMIVLGTVIRCAVAPDGRVATVYHDGSFKKIGALALQPPNELGAGNEYTH